MWLSTGKGQRTSKIEKTIDVDSDFVAIKRVNFKLSAGISGYEVEYLNGHRAPIFFRRDWLVTRHLNASSLFAVEVSGQSMEPSLFEGDLAVVNAEDTTPIDGEVFAANYEGELVIKRMLRNNGEWFLSSDNSDKRRYSDKRCDEQTSIIGRIIHKQSERI
jgi:phage repressor protein C with HTH and peptisase S24 domain